MTTDDLPDFWLAHEAPERPLAPGAYVCSCDSCAIAVTASGRRNRDLFLVVVFGAAPRTMLDPTEYLAHRHDLPGAFASGDYVRQVYVA